VRSWHDRTPAGFTFVLKGSRFVTHRKRLKDCGEAVGLFYERTKALKRKLAAVLWQLPPGLAADLELLEAFLERLPARPRAVLEFRNASWYTDKLYAVLRRHGAAFCIHDMRSGGSPDTVTAPLAYLRFHGFGTRYGGDYPDEHLRERAHRLKGLPVREAYVFFNNDVGGHAVKNALRLKELVSGKVSDSARPVT
jgi:uncharacterized protein YecE (DUF72 family)